MEKKGSTKDEKGMKKLPKIPIILYEEGDKNPIPYIEVGLHEEMPKVLFISEYKETGEDEVDPELGSRPIVDVDIRKYVDMEALKEVLDEETNDKVRVALGMLPLREAQKLGQKRLDKVYDEAERQKEKLQTDQETRAKRAFTLGEDLQQKTTRFLKEEKEKKEN